MIFTLSLYKFLKKKKINKPEFPFKLTFWYTGSTPETFMSYTQAVLVFWE